MVQQPPAADEERRLVTVLFADLVGYTSISEARDPELIQEALNICFDRLAVEVGRFGGYVDKVVGDEIMALFGAPRAQEDDAGKAVAAALAMQRALEDLSPQLVDRLGQGFSMRVGINTGLVVTGAIGPGGYTVTGDAVNVAARLEKAGSPGDIVVGEATRRLARRQFRWGERQELTVKGRAEPVVCYTVEGALESPMRLVPAPSDTPFVGRTAYLERLRAEWDACASGGSRVLEVSGEAGIGKTRLLAHLLAQIGAPAERVLYTRADTPPRTFGPILQLLPNLRHLPAGFVQNVELLARAHELAQPPEVDPDWLVRGLTDTLAGLTGAGPVIFVMDDFHRADRATVATVDRLLPRIASLPVLVLLLRQPAGRRPRRLTGEQAIEIAPLADDEAPALVEAVAPALAPAVAAEIVARAGGNPLYLELLANTAAAAPDADAVPQSLQTAVAARVDELDETSRRLLREASVFGQSFYEEPLKLTTTVTEGLYESLAHLCEIGLLDAVPDGRARAYQFRHSLVQEVLYQGLLHRQRGTLHRSAAQALELAAAEGLDVEPEQLAFHFQEAGDTERAAEYFLAAAERADHLRAPVEASRHRRAANRLLNVASLAGLYAAHGRPSIALRAAAAALQAALAVALLAPMFFLFATRRPDADNLTLGLPTEIIEFNVSSIVIAVVLGGLPLLVAGIAFSHLAVPVLMRRHVSLARMAGVILAGWAIALAFALLGYGALVLLLRLDLLDRVSSIYVGAATLRLLLGDYSLAVAMAAATLAVAVAWTVLLRIQARSWAHARRPALGPRELEERRRWAVVRQTGVLAAGAGILTVAMSLAYQLGLLPGAAGQGALDPAPFVGLLLPFAALSVAGGGAAITAARKLSHQSGAYQLGAFGFEVPLVLALVVGIVAWFGMRQAVVSAANNVDTPGNLAAFNRAVAIFPDLGLGYYLRGERYLADGDFERAREEFDRAAELDPEFPATFLARGRVHIALGDFEAARDDGARIIELRPDHPGGYAIRAWARFELGDTAGAAEDLAMATRPLPQDARAWDAFFVRCLALYAVQRYDEAETDCKRVLELNPGHIISLDHLALIAFARAGRQTDADAAMLLYGQGITYLDQLLDVAPNNALAYKNRGEAYSLIQRYDDAVRDLTRAIDIDPDIARAHLERGLAQLFLGRGDEALRDVARAVDLYRADPERALREGIRVEGLYSTQLYVAVYADAHGVAVAAADELETLGLRSPWSTTMRGLARFELGDRDAAFADFDAAIAADPDFAYAYERRGYARFRLGDHDGATADFEQALSLLTVMTPQERAELHYHRALLFEAQGRNTAALAELDEALELVQVPSVRQAIDDARSALEGRMGAGG